MTTFMSQSQPFQGTAAQSQGWSFRQAFQGAMGLANEGLVTMLNWYDVAQERRSLRTMSDETLKDIGISRTEAMHEAGRRFWDLDETD